jgi:type II secretory pathway component PulF
MRRTIGAALVYPMIVVALAYAVFVLLVTYLAPILSGAFRDLAQSSEPFVNWLAWAGVNAVWWVFWPPAALAALLFAEWLQTRRGFETSDGPVSRLIARVWPGIKRSRRDARLAAFLEILSLLVREQTPLPDALRLAANASGDEGLRNSAATLAERLTNGQSISSEEVRSLNIPPLLGFMLTTGSHRSGLSEALAANARRYRERSSNTATRTSLVLPIVLTACIGGTVTLALALSTIWPIWQLVFRLGA